MGVASFVSYQLLLGRFGQLAPQPMTVRNAGPPLHRNNEPLRRNEGPVTPQQ